MYTSMLNYGLRFKVDVVQETLQNTNGPYRNFTLEADVEFICGFAMEHSTYNSYSAMGSNPFIRFKSLHICMCCAVGISNISKEATGLPVQGR